MEYFQDAERAAKRWPHSVVAIGNFDGLHLGHLAALNRAQAQAQREKAPLLILTFEPHPRRLFQPELPPFRLTPMRARLRRARAAGADAVLALRFSHALAAVDAESFVRDTLRATLKARTVVVGGNFRFGAKRRGSVETLKRMGMHTLVVPPVRDSAGQIISSSRIRALLTQGDLPAAAALLGHPYEIEGRVQPGAGRGTKFGTATANLSLGPYHRPRYGVYAVRAQLPPAKKKESLDANNLPAWLDGVANLGIRPMFPAAEPLLETHIFNMNEPLRGRRLRVALMTHLRDEAAFASETDLTAQMQKDRENARAILARA